MYPWRLSHIKRATRLTAVKPLLGTISLLSFLNVSVAVDSLRSPCDGVRMIDLRVACDRTGDSLWKDLEVGV
jgi:hypothetical protein